MVASGWPVAQKVTIDTLGSSVATPGNIFRPWLRPYYTKKNFVKQAEVNIKVGTIFSLRPWLRNTALHKNEHFQMVLSFNAISKTR
jgi:hypothetical protein